MAIRDLFNLSELSDKEFEEFKTRQLKAGVTTEWTPDSYYDRLYRNKKFIERFGENTFDSMEDPDERDNLYNQVILGEELERYSNDPNIDLINNMTQEGQIELLKSGYLSQDEMNKESLEKENLDERVKAAISESTLSNLPKNIGSRALEGAGTGFLLGTGATAFLGPGAGITGTISSILGAGVGAVWGAGETLYDYFNPESQEESIKARNQELFEDIRAKDISRKRNSEEVQSMSSEIKSNIIDGLSTGDTSTEAIDKAFNEIVGNQSNDPDNPIYGSAFYQAWKDSELKDLDTDTKIQIVSDFYAMSSLYGQDAFEGMDQIFQDIAADRQSLLKKGWFTVTRNVTGLASDFAQISTDLIAAGIETIQGQEAAYDYLNEGKIGGVDLGVLGPDYWNKVGKYNTFSLSDIEEADKLGGVSRFQSIYGTDSSEWNPLRMIQESLGQMHYLAYYGLMGKAFGAAGKKLNLSENTLFNASAVVAPNLSMSAQMGYEAFNNVSEEALSTYKDKVNATLNEKINEQLEQVDWDAAVKEYKNNLRSSEQGTMFASDDKLKEMLQMQYTEELRSQLLPEAEAENADILNQAKVQAMDAFRMEAILDLCKNSVNATTFRGWMYNNNKVMQRKIRDDKLGITFKGNKATVKGKPDSFIKTALKESFGEGFDEYLDGVTAGISSGYNIGQFNNWLQQRENPESVDNTTMLVAGLSGMSMGIKEANNKDTFYEAALGAISPWLPLFQRGSARPGKKFRSFVTNAIYEEYISQLERGVDANIRVKAINDFITSHMDEIENAASVVSYNENIEKARKSGDVKALKDAEQQQLTYIAALMESATEDAGGASVVQQMNEKLGRLVNNEYSAEEREQLGKEFISQPENKDSGMTAEEGYARLRHNAQKLFKTIGEISRIRETINKNESTRDLSLTAKNHLIQNALQEEDWENRLNQIVGELGISKSNSPLIDTSVLASKKDAEDIVKSIEDDRQALIDNNIALNAEIGKKKEELNKLRKDPDLNTRERKIEINKAKREIEALEQAGTQLSKELTRINSIKGEYENAIKNWNDDRAVLSATEILNSGASNILYMIENRDRFSEKQKAQIDEAVNTLSSKDSNYKTKLNDAAEITASLESTKRTNTSIKEAPLGYDTLVKRLKDIKKKDAEKRMYSRYEEAVFSSWLNASDSDILSDILEGRATKDMLDKFINTMNNNGVARTELNQISEVVDFYKSLIGFIDSSKPNANALAQSIGNIIKVSKSRDEAIELLNNVLGDTSIPIELREDIKELLETSRVLDNAKSATFKQEKEDIERQERERTEKEKTEAEILAQQHAEYERKMAEAAEEAAKEDSQRKAEESDKVNPDVPPSENNDGATEDDDKKAAEEIEKTPVDREPIEQKDEEEVDLGVPYNPESSVPTPGEDKIEEDIIQAEKNGEVTIVQPNDEEDENKVGKAKDGEFAGNELSRYRVINGVVKRREEVENITGKLLAQFNWVDSANLNYQEVIDNELQEIAKLDPDVRILKVNPKNNATNDSVMWDINLLVVEYTDEIADIHKGDSGIITANGKKWLVIGALGFNRDSQEQKKKYYKLNENANKNGLFKTRALEYFYKNPNERFCVLEGISTKISRINPGRLVTEDSTHPAGEHSISDLLKGTGYTLRDMLWGIQTKTGLALVGRVDRTKLLMPHTGIPHLGNVFIMIPAAGGQYITAYIKPVFSNEIKQDSELKKEINKAMTMLVSNKHRDRYKALQILSQYLYFDKNTKEGLGNYIEIGTANSNIITITQEGKSESFNLDDPNTSKLDIINKLISAKFRIQISRATLDSTNMDTLLMYDEAGALITNLQKFGTSGADFNVYEIGEDGNPIIPESPIEVGISASPRKNVTTSGTLYNGNIFFKDAAGIWRNFNGSKVTDPTTLSHIEYINEINNGKSPSSYIGSDAVYVFNEDINNPIVIKVSSVSNNITELSKEKAIEYIKEQERLKEEKAREDKVKEELEKARKEQESFKAEEDVPLEDDLNDFEDFLFGDDSDDELDGTTEGESSKGSNDEDSSGNHLIGIGLTANTIIIDNLNEFLSIIDEKIKSGVWKNVPDRVTDIIKYLETKNIPINNINVSPQAWLDMIRNCR